MRRVFLSHAADPESVEIAHFIARGLAEFGIEVALQDRFRTTQPARETTQDTIKQCSLVIAVLTKPSPNVFYELGYAEGIGKEVIILSNERTLLPSDLNAITMVRFDPHDSSFLQRLLHILHQALSRKLDVDKVDYLLRDRLLTSRPEDIFQIYKQHPGTFERIDNRLFEQIVVKLFEKTGLRVHQPSENSPTAFDFAVEGFEGAKKIIIEVKKYNAGGKVSVGQAQSLLGAVVAEGSDFGVLITPSELTGTALDFVSRCKPRIELWKMEDLRRRLGYSDAANPFLYDVFISHTAKDMEVAKLLAGKLARRNLKVFLAMDQIRPGEDPSQALRQAIRKAREMVVVLSPNSVKSEWLGNEWAAAWILERRITPLFLDISPKDVPPRLQELQGFDLSRLDEFVNEAAQRKDYAEATEYAPD